MRSKVTVEVRRTMPIDLVALVEQQFGQVGAVLAGDSGDERTLGHHAVVLEAPVRVCLLG